MPSGNPNMGENKVSGTGGAGPGTGGHSMGGGLGSSKSSGSSTGNTSKGGSTSGGGKMGASSSQSGGVKSGGSTGNTSKGGSTSSGKMGAKSSQSGGVKGPSSSNARGSSLGGGLSSAAAASAAASRSARAAAVSRGPGVTAGTRPGSTAQAQQRTATSLGLSTAEQYGLDPNRTVAAMRQMVAPSIAGETAGLPAVEQAAAARSMFNRMNLAAAGLNPTNNPQFTTDLNSLMEAYDANGLRPGTRQNAAFRGAVPGTRSYADALNAIANGMSPYGNLQSAPSVVKEATHYYEPKTANPAWGRSGFTQFGAQKFGIANKNGIPDTTAATVEAARNQVLGSPGGFGALSPAVAQPANPSMPALAGPGNLDSSIAAAIAGMPQNRAQGIPTPNEQVNGYLGGMASLTPARPSIASTGFPAARPNMNMAGYSSPMLGLAGMPQAPSNMAMAGYSSPMTGLSGMPPSRNPVSGMSFNPGLPRSQVSGMSFNPSLPTNNGFAGTTPNMDMSGYTSPMTGLTGMPQAPSNMNMTGYTSPMAGLTGMPPAPSNMNMGGYRSPMDGLTGMPPAVAADGLETAQPEDDPMDPVNDPEAAPGGWWGAAKKGWGLAGDVVKAGVSQARPVVETIKENIDNPLLGPAAAISRMFSGLGPGATRRDPTGSRSSRSGAAAYASNLVGNKKKSGGGSSSTSSAKLPWETTPTNPQDYPPMPFVPPQLVERDRLPWLWGSWA